MDRKRSWVTRVNSCVEIIGRPICGAGMVGLLAAALVSPLSSARSDELAFAPIPDEIESALKSLGIAAAEFVIVAVPAGPGSSEPSILTYAGTQPGDKMSFNRFEDGNTVAVWAPKPVDIGPNERAELLILKFASPGNGVWCDRNGDCTSR